MKIVVLDGHTANPGDNPWTELERLGELTVYPRTSRDERLARCRHATVLVTNKVPLDDALLQQLPELKFIAVAATGFNIVDVAAARKSGIVVSNVPAYSTDSVAQLVFAGLLAWIYRPELHDAAIKVGEWKRSADFSFWKTPLFELAGKTIGIVGLGQIGRAVATIANAMGMKVIAYSRRQTNPLPYDGFQWMDLNGLFGNSDIISLHCPQTEQTTGFVNAGLIARMKPNSILINTARGGLINESDLASALNSNQIAGAFLDVVSTEPILDDNPLLTARNCLLTPHQGWATIEARRRLMSVIVENVAAFQSGQPINVVS